MKLRILTTTLFAVFYLSAKSQTSNAIFFTENGEKFQLVLNGILQNASPETNVKLTELNAPSYRTRVLFEDKSLGFVDYSLNFVDMGLEITYIVKKNNKGSYVVRYVSEVPLAQAPPPAPDQTVVVYSTTPPPAASTTVTHQTTTTSTGNPENVSINMGMNVNGEGGGISMNVSGMEGTSHSSTTTTTTTHSSTTTYSEPAPAPAPVPAPSTTVVYVNGYNGAIGCPVPMNSGDFDSFKNSVSSKSFEESKFTMAKQVLNNNCLTASQVKETMGLFSFEQTKVDFAKYAYGHTYDINNYYKVNDAFTFESSIEDLNNYISGQK